MQAKKIGWVSGDKLWSSILSQLIQVSAGGRRRGHAWKEPVGSCWYPAPSTEKGILTLSHLDGSSRSFIWCKLAMIPGLVFHRRSLTCVLSFPAVLVSTRNKRKNDGLERTIPHLLTGRIGGWDNFKQAPFLAPERGCLFLYIWGRLIPSSYYSTLKQRETSTVTGRGAWRTCQETEEKHLKAFCAFLILVWFFIHFGFFLYDRVKVLSHQLDTDLYLLFINPSCYCVVCAISTLKQSTAAFPWNSFAILGWTCPTFFPLQEIIPPERTKSCYPMRWQFRLASGGTIGDPHLCGHTTSIFCRWKKATGLEQEEPWAIYSPYPPKTSTRVSSGNELVV